jgi:hypothetical protein
LSDQPTPPPLDLDKMEAFARKNYFDAASVASADVLALVAEVRRLRAENKRLQQRSSEATLSSGLIQDAYYAHSEAVRYVQERDAARADLAAARAALDTALVLVQEALDNPYYDLGDLDWFARARAALADRP